MNSPIFILEAITHQVHRFNLNNKKYQWATLYNTKYHVTLNYNTHIYKYFSVQKLGILAVAKVEPGEVLSHQSHLPLAQLVINSTLIFPIVSNWYSWSVVV